MNVQYVHIPAGVCFFPSGGGLRLSLLSELHLLLLHRRPERGSRGRRRRYLLGNGMQVRPRGVPGERENKLFSSQMSKKVFQNPKLRLDLLAFSLPGPSLSSAAAGLAVNGVARVGNPVGGVAFATATRFNWRTLKKTN